MTWKKRRFWNNMLPINCVTLHKYLTCKLGIKIPTIQGGCRDYIREHTAVSTGTGILENLLKLLFTSF